MEILIGGIIGLVIGLIPLIYGFKKDFKSIGFTAMLLSIASAAILSWWLSLAIVAVECFIIYMGNKKRSEQIEKKRKIRAQQIEEEEIKKAEEKGVIIATDVPQRNVWPPVDDGADLSDFPNDTNNI